MTTQYKITVTNQNGSLIATPASVPTAVTTAVSDLSYYSNTVTVLAYDAITYANAVAYVDEKSYVNTSQLYSNLINYQTTSDLASNVATLTANDSLNLGGTYYDSYVNVSGSYTITGVHTLSANLVIQPTATIIANGAAGNVGQVLTSNGSSIYWSTVSGGGGGSVNTAEQYVWTNTHTFNANVTFSSIISVGNSSVNSVVNSTSFTGTSNSANFLGNSSGTLANIASWVTGNSATAYSNAVANAAALYQTSAGLSDNVATLTSNSANFLGNSSGTLANVASWVTGNAATAYSNATGFASNATNISSGTLSYDRLGPNVVNTTADFTISGNLNFTASNNNFNLLKVGANVVINTTAIKVTDGVANVTITSNNISANTSSLDIGNLTVFGNLVVKGTQTIVNTQSLSVTDSMILLAANNTTDILDIGFVGHYSNGSANSHAGVFRDAGNKKFYVMSSYALEPSNNNIDINDSSFTLGILAANTFEGNLSGTANNSNNIGGVSLSTLQTQITGNAATAYSNAVSNAAALYQTTAGLSANVATFTANAATFLGNSSGTIANVASWITGNAAAAYSNAVSNAAALYQTTAGLSANVATLTSNAANFLGNSSGTIANVASWITGNSDTAYTNATTFSANATNITNGTLPMGRLGANVVNTSSNFQITGMYTFGNGITFANTVTANSSNGTAGQVLTSSGSSGNVYWSTPSSGGFANGDSITVNNFVITGAFTANSSNGTAGQVLTSNGSATYWSTVSGSGTVTQINSGDGLTGGPITSSGTLSVLANTGIIANTTGLHANLSVLQKIITIGTSAPSGGSDGDIYLQYT